MAYNVFISYSSKDLPYVNQIMKKLSYPNINVFVSEYSISPGEPLTEKIIKNIKKCNVLVLLWSHAAKKSGWVREEVAIARSENKKIIPVMLKKHIKLPKFIEDLNYLPLYKSPEDSMDWLQKHILKSAERKQKKDAFALVGFFILLISLLLGGEK